MDNEKLIRFLVYFVLIVLIYFIGYLNVFNKVLRGELLNKKAEFYVVSQNLKDREETIDRFNKIAAKYKEKRSSISKINKALFENEKDQFKILSAIFNLASASRMSVEAFSFGEFKSAENGKAGSLQVNISVKGSYENFKKFLDEISYTLPLIDIENVTFQSSTGGGEGYALQLSVYTKNAPAQQSVPQESQTPKEGNENLLEQKNF